MIIKMLSHITVPFILMILANEYKGKCEKGCLMCEGGTSKIAEDKCLYCDTIKGYKLEKGSCV